MEIKKIIPVVCAIIEQNDKFLVAQRSQGQSNAGLWEFPGGKVHNGEDPKNALHREIDEELCIGIEIRESLESVKYDYSWISIELIPFICKLTSGVPVPVEHNQVRFIDAKEAKALRWASADILILDRYLDKIRD